MGAVAVAGGRKSILETTVRAANTVFAGPTSGADALPTFRALVAGDIPALSYAPVVHVHAATDITSASLALARGGTGADLSGTGPGFLKQASLGAAVTVAALSSSDIPWGTPGAIGATTPSTGLFTTIGVGTGTTAPVTEAQVVSTSTSSPRGVMSAQYNTGTDGARFHMRKARGTLASPTAVVTGDTLGKLVASGYDGTNYLEMGAITIEAEGTIASARVPTRIAFSTATDAAPSVLTERMRITSGGQFGFGTASPNASATAHFHRTYAGSNSLFITNDSTNSAALVDMRIGLSPANFTTDYASFALLGANYGTAGILTAKTVLLEANASSNLVISNFYSSGAIQFCTNGRIERMRIDSTGLVVCATKDTATNSITNLLTLGHATSGTPAAGFGNGILFQGYTNGGGTTQKDMAQIAAVWTTATDASRASALTFSTLTAGGSLTEMVRITNTGLGVGINPGYILDVSASSAGAALFRATRASTSRGITIDAEGQTTHVSSLTTLDGIFNFALETALKRETSVSAEATAVKFTIPITLTAGSDSNTAIKLTGAINQSGGTGITRGLWLNQSIAAAVDYRALEITGGKVLLGTGNVGIAVSSPATVLHAASSSTASPRGIMSSQHNNGADGARFHMRKSRGTVTAPTTIVTDDVLGKLVASGHDGTNYLEMGSISIEAEGTIASTRVPTRIVFSTATDAAPSVLTERMRINSAGETIIGGATDYIKFEADGTLVFNGAATVWDDVVVSGQTVRTGADAPTWKALSGGIYGWAFQPATVNDQVFFSIQLPHGYKEGTDVKMHIHIVAPTNPAVSSVTKWGLEYVIAGINGTYSGTTVYGTCTIGTSDAMKNLLLSFTDISGVGLGISSVLICRLFRAATDSADTYDSYDVFLASADAHVEMDTVGSRTATAK